MGKGEERKGDEPPQLKFLATPLGRPILNPNFDLDRQQKFTDCHRPTIKKLCPNAFE